MTAGWVAGSVRAKAMLNRRVGAGQARALAMRRSLTEGQHHLVATSYGRHVAVGQTLAETEHAVAALPLWHLRVLAGWQPRGGSQVLRSLAAAFEAANIIAHSRYLAGAQPQPFFDLGALATTWPRLGATTSLTDLRAELARSPWGDPGGDTPSEIAFGVQVGLATRVATTVPEASSWAAGGLLLLVARRRLLEQHQFPGDTSARAVRVLGKAAVQASDLSGLAESSPAAARWVLDGVEDAGGLWRGEAAWWSRLERDGFRLLSGTGFSRARSVGSFAVLAADARRCRAAVHIAARGGGPLEVFDAVA